MLTAYAAVRSVTTAMDEIKETAEYYRLGLILGIVSVSEAMGWLDAVLVSEPEPDIALIEASLSGSRGPWAVAEELKQVQGQCTRQAVTYRLFAAMLRRLRQDRKAVQAITGWLYVLVSEGYIPDEGAELLMWSFGDEFSLAAGGIYGDMNEITGRLAQFLTKYAVKDS